MAQNNIPHLVLYNRFAQVQKSSPCTSVQVFGTDLDNDAVFSGHISNYSGHMSRSQLSHAPFG